MANTLTDLQGQIYTAVDVVSRELTGMIPAATINAEASRAQVGKEVKAAVSTATAGVDITPSMTIPDPADKTVDNRGIVITKSRAWPWAFTGEETQGLNTGVGYQSTQVQEIAQAIRTGTNEVETDLVALYKQMAWAYGTAGTTPFASNLSDTAQIRKLLVDNGAPAEAGWNLIIDTTAGAKMRTLTQLSKANEAADDTLLRQGTLLEVHGGRIRESGQIALHTKGTASSATTDDTGYAIGSTTITLASAGTGTILAGDVVTFAGDTTKYLVTTGDSDVSDGGTIVLAEPGLKVAIAASATAITVGNNYTPNMAFTSNAIQLAARMPALPEGGDSAVERMQVIDPRSGLVFEFAKYLGYHKVRFEVSLAWGVACIKPEHTAILLG